MVVDQFAEFISRQTMKVQVRLFTFLLWAALCISDYTVVQASPVTDASEGSNQSTNEHTRGLLALFVLAVSLVVVSFPFWFYGYARSNITRRVLRTFEVVNYPVDEDVGFGAPRCTACLVPFTEGGRVTVLPICRHIYACLRRWMASDILSCPDCRQHYRPVAVWRLRDCFP